MLVVFDLDDALAPINGPLSPETARLLAQLQAQGVKLALASGKPCAYLAGWARAYLQAAETVLIGENGADIWLSGIMPSVRLSAAVPDQVLQNLRQVRVELARRWARVLFFQPNQVAVTAFPRGNEAPTIDTLGDFVEGMGLPGIIVHRHPDSIDCAPAELNKGTAVMQVADHLGLPLAEVIAVGDSANDIPMFQAAGCAICVGGHPRAAAQANHPVDTPEQALRLVMQLCLQGGTRAWKE